MQPGVQTRENQRVLDAEGAVVEVAGEQLQLGVQTREYQLIYYIAAGFGYLFYSLFVMLKGLMERYTCRIHDKLIKERRGHAVAEEQLQLGIQTREDQRLLDAEGAAVVEVAGAHRLDDAGTSRVPSKRSGVAQMSTGQAIRITELFRGRANPAIRRAADPAERRRAKAAKKGNEKRKKR